MGKTILKFSILPIASLFIIQSTTIPGGAQVQEEWVRYFSYSSQSWNLPYSIAVDELNNVYVTGYSGTSSQGTHGVTVKYNSSGVQQWYRYDTSLEDAFLNGLDHINNLYVAGSIVLANDNTAILIIKYSPAGDVIWKKSFLLAGDVQDGAFAMKIDRFNNINICGERRLFGYTTYDYLILKIDWNGTLIWSKFFNGGSDDRATAIDVDNLGNVYVTGFAATNNNMDFITIKYSYSGTRMWISNYNSPVQGSDDQAWAITLDVFGNVCVTGFSGVLGVWPYECTTVKYDNNGVQQWVARLDDATDYWPEALKTDNAGNIYMVGNIGTTKYNSAGQFQWYKNEGCMYNLVIDGNNNIYVSGANRVEGYGLYTIKYNSMGNKLWEKNFGSGSSCQSEKRFNIVLDPSNNVYITGATGSGYGDVFTTIKYSQPIGINPISNEIPNKFSLSQNYPNPFNPSTKIRFTIPLAKGVGGMILVSLKIYDIPGREIVTLVNEKLKPGSYEVEWDGSNYPSGVYFYKLNAGEYVETKKMILLK